MRKVSSSSVIKMLNQDSVVQKIGTLDMDTLSIRAETVDFLANIIDRKMSHTFKGQVVKKIKDGSIRFIATSAIPNYLTVFPLSIDGRICTVVNLAYLIDINKNTDAKAIGEEIEKNIEYRTIL